MFTRVILVVTLAQLGLASPLEKVCLPSAWRAETFGTRFHWQNGKMNTTSVSGRHFVDYSSNLEAFHEEITADGETDIVYTVHNFNEMRTYEMNIRKGSCTTKVISPTRRLRRWCAGDEELSLIDSFTLDGKMADTYRLPIHHTEGEETGEMTVMRDTFLYVSTTMGSRTPESSEVITTQYSNVMEGIPDRSVFHIRSVCLPPPTRKRVCISEQFEVYSRSNLVMNFIAPPKPFKFLYHARDFRKKLEVAIDTRLQITTLYDWMNGTVYRFDNTAQYCMISSTPAPAMIEMCSDSENMKWMKSFSVDGKMADEYKMIFNPNLSATIRVFRDTFELINSINAGNEGFSTTLIQYGNMTKGIQDETVFNIPSYCHSSSNAKKTAPES